MGLQIANSAFLELRGPDLTSALSSTLHLREAEPLSSSRYSKVGFGPRL